MKTYLSLLVVFLLIGKSYGSLGTSGLESIIGDLNARKQNGNGKIVIEGELRQWHKITLTMDGPFANELDREPNPFTDYNMTVTFTHESGKPSYTLPGYFAADGNAANTGAEQGIKWRAHFSPNKTGMWNYRVSFKTGKMAAVSATAKPTPLKPYHDKTGKIIVMASDKKGKDFRAQGSLEYVGKHYLQFSGSKAYFLKAGADAPETLLAYEDFDGTYTLKTPLKKYQKHIADWKPGDPEWKNGKGKGLIGALSYLSEKGVTGFSFLTYNAGGDGDNVWPFVKRDEKYNYDCSKLDQWQIVFDHAQKMGLHCNFKTQETENDDNTIGRTPGIVPESLDGGDLGPQRKLYLRELVARFSYLLALSWNMGEENTQTSRQQRDMIAYVSGLDPYRHNIVIHTFPHEQEKVYRPLLGDSSKLTGLSLQNEWDHVHQRTLQWVRASDSIGRAWVVANDEQGPAEWGVPPDPGYPGFKSDKLKYDIHDIRKQTLWGNLMAGGAGLEYYFGYKLPENDLLLEDFRSRDQSWNYCGVALNFFKDHKIPVQDMHNCNSLVGNPENGKQKFCFAKQGQIYLVYLAYTLTSSLDLKTATGNFDVNWYNPRTGGKLLKGSVNNVIGGSVVALGEPPAERGQDWLAVITKR